MSNNVIWIVTDAPPSALNPPSTLPPIPDTSCDGQRRNPYPPEPPAPKISQRAIPVRVDQIEQNMTDFLSNMGRVLNPARQSAAEVAGMELEEIELSVEINGEGQVSLLGSGVKASSKGAMTLKFKAKAK